MFIHYGDKLRVPPNAVQLRIPPALVSLEVKIPVSLSCMTGCPVLSTRSAKIRWEEKEEQEQVF